LACGTVLAAAAAAAYSRTYAVPLIFDDRPTIAENATIRHWGTALMPPANTAATGRPIVNLSLAINYAVSGTGVWSYHALNQAIHILAGLTLFGLVRRLLEPVAGPPTVWIAFCTALVWTLHPLQTESVTYIVQRAESLMGLFYLQTVYWFVRWQGPVPAPSDPEGGRLKPSERPLCAVLSVAFCALGMATKEVMVSAPLVVLLVDRLCFAGSFGEALRRRKPFYIAIAATWALLALLVLHAGILADLLLHTGNRSEISGTGPGPSAWRYWATQPEAICRYLKLAVWPHPLVLDYGTQWLSPLGQPAPFGTILSRLVGPAVVVAALAAATLYGLVRNTALGVLGFCFFAILAPTSLVPGDRETAADHRMYLALIPVALAVVMAMHRRLGRALLPVVMVLSATLGLVTYARNRDYSSELAIWSDTVAKRPENFWARFNLGGVLLGVPGRLDDAIAQLGEALREKPDSADGHVDLGSALASEPGRLNEAVDQFEEALRLEPGLYGAHIDLGNALLRTPGRLDDAIAQYEDALRLRPDSAEAHFNLGNALSRIPGRSAEAIAQYEEALRLRPAFAKAHFSLAVALLGQPGRVDEAVAHLEAGLRIEPGDAQARRILDSIRGHRP
jgi:tetratricopeptide (TPR) repeat protein